MTKATVYFTGLVVWQPPAVYKSSCAIDVEFFPYDVQTCVLKLGSWTYDGFKVVQNQNSITIYIYIYALLQIVVLKCVHEIIICLCVCKIYFILNHSWSSLFLPALQNAYLRIVDVCFSSGLLEAKTQTLPIIW